MLLLYRVSVFTFLMLLCYVINLMVFGPVHSTSKGVVGMLRAGGGNDITAMLSGVRALTVVVKNSDETRLLRLVRMLDTAVYDVCRVDLVVVTFRPLLLDWRHGGVRFTSTFDAVGNASLVVVLHDAMEVSPFFALWFLLQHTDTVVSSGGGSPLHPAGLAVDYLMWNEVVRVLRHRSVYDAITSVCNCTAVFPALSDGRVFVRHAFQSPMRVEHSPKLVRSWDLSRSQWGL